jgi:hypothetical protein
VGQQLVHEPRLVNPVKGAWSKVEDAGRWRCGLTTAGTGVRHQLVAVSGMAGLGAQAVEISGSPDLRRESVEVRWL